MIITTLTADQIREELAVQCKHDWAKNLTLRNTESEGGGRKTKRLQPINSNAKQCKDEAVRRTALSHQEPNTMDWTSHRRNEAVHVTGASHLETNTTDSTSQRRNETVHVTAVSHLETNTTDWTSQRMTEAVRRTAVSLT